MKLRRGRFTVDFSSWDYDLSNSVVGFLNMVQDFNPKHPLVDSLFESLSRIFGDGWCVLSGSDVDKAIRYTHGYCFCIYDATNEQELVCFRPDSKGCKVNSSFLPKKEESSNIAISVCNTTMSEEMKSFTTRVIRNVFALNGEADGIKDIDDARASMIRNSIQKEFSGAFHVVISDQNDVCYRLDSSASNIFSANVQDSSILIWDMSYDITKGSSVKRISFLEHNSVNITSMGGLLLFLTLVIRSAVDDFSKRSKCVQDSACDLQVLDATLIRTKHMFAGFLITLFAYILLQFYRRIRMSTRHTDDSYIYEEVILKNEKKMK